MRIFLPSITFEQGVPTRQLLLNTMMKFQRSMSLLVILAVVSMCSGHIGGIQSMQDVSPQIYCGRSLARILSMLCFNQGGPDKRSESGTMYNSILLPYYKDLEYGQGYGLPWLTPHKARGMKLPSRGKRFVVNECCDKACSVEELMSYC